MNIAIVGTGYVGLVSGTCFAEMGVDVTCVDVDKEKIERLQQGDIPIYEPGLDEMVLRNQREGRLYFTTELKSCINDVELVFCAVGTPPDEDGSADLKYVLSVAREFGQLISKYTVLVTKSTVPVGTARKVKAAIQAELDKRGANIPFDVASNPEFLKEGAAIKDFMSPDRVVVGVESERAKELMTRLYRPFMLNNFRVIYTDIPSAEMIKYAANSMLATRISFMNDIANLCELVGADAEMVRKGIGSDTRIGRKFLYPGCGYGGSCFPKDVKALVKTAEKHGYDMQVLKAVESVNTRQKTVPYRKLVSYYAAGRQENVADEEVLKGKTIAIWGLAFKPETDDMRESTSLVTLELLLKVGCKVKVYDPVALEECKRRMEKEPFARLIAEQGDIYYATDMYDAVLDTDALLMLTEWKQFRMPSWGVLKKTMREPLIIDGRNIYDKHELAEYGFIYKGIGQ